MSAWCDISKFIRSIDQAKAKARAAAAMGLRDAALMVLSRAQAICPKETGFLAASATWEGPIEQGQSFVMRIGFNASYAAAVHERLEARHAAPTQAKFLETAIREGGEQALEAIRKRVAAVM